MKKLLCILMILALTLSVTAVPAFAGSEEIRISDEAVVETGVAIDETAESSGDSSEMFSEMFSELSESSGDSGEETSDQAESSGDYSELLSELSESTGDSGEEMSDQAESSGDSSEMLSELSESGGDSGEEMGDQAESSGDSGDSSSMTGTEITGPYEIEETPIEFESHGLTLRGILTVPVMEAEKIPVAVLTHSFGANYYDTADIAEALGKNGVASVRFNLTGCGDSDGKYVDVTFTSQKEDVLAALEYAKSLDFADTDNLFLIGKSQGGFDSCLASVDCKDEIKALILWYPAICIPDDFNSGRIMYVTFDVENIPETVNFMGMLELNREYILEGMAIDPLKDFTVFQKDVLMIHGTADMVVNYNYAVELANAYPNATLVTIEGGNHGFYGDDLTFALETTVSFVLDEITGGTE